MNARMAIPVALGTMALVCCAGLDEAGAQNDRSGADVGLGGTANQTLVLTPAQRSAIYAAASKDVSKRAPTRFPAVVGADVPPMIELYALPDAAVAENPAANFYRYTVVQDQVVLVDPTKMRVIDVIGPPPKR